ncbi:hypothetical protein CONLIGDRAFT_112224 [Coniochaeta ligniaria NRRL 30616]|uniref:PPIase FKBP-type domain-containing protein n=1 Tax=Coniochaeta ligniaria NRRL 30616 TaxID=1408157 RepID=A0A1J7IRX7_9PEZI|nr:hypothetical protein CONLIGDRAFT_112224 [Coniochaeta ligniaria NRRL 30616]
MNTMRKAPRCQQPSKPPFHSFSLAGRCRRRQCVGRRAKVDVTLYVECGRKTQKGDKIQVHYKGTLQSDGSQFEASASARSANCQGVSSSGPSLMILCTYGSTARQRQESSTIHHGTGSSCGSPVNDSTNMDRDCETSQRQHRAQHANLNYKLPVTTSAWNTHIFGTAR